MNSRESTEKRKQYKKEWALRNKERLAIKQKEWYENNKEKRKEYVLTHRENYKEYSKKYYDKNKEKRKEYNQINKDKQKKYGENYRETNKEKLKEYRQTNKEKHNKLKYQYVSDRKKHDPIFKVRESVRKVIYKSITRGGYTKKSRTHQILGCSFAEFKEHLEKQFEPWMTWDNYGLYNGEPNYGWDVDHIIPQSSADTEERLIQLNHYTNLQPLCSKINRDIKKDK